MGTLGCKTYPELFLIESLPQESMRTGNPEIISFPLFQWSNTSNIRAELFKKSTDIGDVWSGPSPV